MASNLTLPGVDYAWAKPSVSGLKTDGVKFAMRYLSHDKSKNLTRDELHALNNAGIAVGLVWETIASRALSGHAGGAFDAQTAKSQADALGLHDIPIYFAVDWDASQQQMSTIASYLRGATEVLGHGRVGVYGGYHVIKYMADNNVCHFFWQTYAWSGGLIFKAKTIIRKIAGKDVHDHAHIYQWKNAVRLHGGTYDLNRGMSEEDIGARPFTGVPKPPTNVGTRCGDIDGCWAQDAVNVGWYGYRTMETVPVQAGPGPHFMIRGTIDAGKRVGWQSVRNPHATDAPLQRGEKNGYAWCYAIDGGLTGWLEASKLEPWDTGKPWADGPAGVDFHVGYGKCTRSQPLGCGGTRVKPAKKRVITAQDVYLRYAPHSTAYYILLTGDRVREVYRSPMGYSCVEVTQSKSARVGARGWVDTKYLK